MVSGSRQDRGKRKIQETSRSTGELLQGYASARSLRQPAAGKTASTKTTMNKKRAVIGLAFVALFFAVLLPPKPIRTESLPSSSAPPLHSFPVCTNVEFIR